MICNRFRLELEKNCAVWKDQRIYVTVSIGITSFSRQTPVDGTALNDAADKALYQAKREGRNRVCG